MEGFVARQPIYDGRGHVFAYELLFRSGPQNAFGGDQEHASRSVIRDSLALFGFDLLTGGRRAFVNVTRDVLLQGLWRELPRDRTVVELLETVEADEAVLAACRQLKAEGYLLALDDFELRPGTAPLVELADFLKVDFLATSADVRARWFERLGAQPARLLAEKIETREQLEAALAEGFTYFQGYYFRRPEMLRARPLPPFKHAALALLRDLLQPDAPGPERVEAHLQQDPGLRGRLLADLNRATRAAGRPVTTIAQAHGLMGPEAFRRWAAMVTMTALGEDRPPELISTCLVRARFCERAAQRLRLDDAPLFFAGLVSGADALVGMPLAQLVAHLAPADAVRAALDGEGAAGRVLQLALAYEQGAWSRAIDLAAALGLAEDVLPALYRDALGWAHQTYRA